MTTTQAVKTSVTVNNCLFQDYPHPENHAPPSYEMTPGFKPFTNHCTFTKILKIKHGQTEFHWYSMPNRLMPVSKFLLSLIHWSVDLIATSVRFDVNLFNTKWMLLNTPWSNRIFLQKLHGLLPFSYSTC